MNTSEVLDWLEEKQICINMLYLIPSLVIGVLLLIVYTYYCYLCVRECRRTAQFDRSKISNRQTEYSAGRSRNSIGESVRQVHRNRQSDMY